MLFGTAGIRGDLTRITPQFALTLGKSVAVFCRGRGLSSVVVGRDGRTSSDMLSEAVIGGVLSQKVEVEDVGRVPTPVLAFASEQGGIMVTASHNPPDNNGLKVFLNHRELYPGEEKEIEEMVNGQFSTSWDVPARRKSDVLPLYEHAVLHYVEKECGTPRRKKVVLDCGNGMGALITPHLLTHLGCEVTTLFPEITGRFERPSEPSEKNISQLKERVVREKADIGFAQDGDADRINVVTEEGEIIPEDSIIALLAGYYVKKGETVVTSINTSFRIDEYVEKKGGHTKRVMLGNLHEGVSKYEAVFAGEPWKHIHCRFGRWIDGMVSAAVLVHLIRDRKASELCSEINSYPMEKINLQTENRTELLALFKEHLKTFTDIKECITVSGIRANFEDGSWILVRPSGTEPKVRIIIEGVTPRRFALLKNFVFETLNESKSLYSIVN